LYRLTLEAQKRVAKSPLSKPEIVRRLGTSAAQLYRLLDQTNYRKSVDQLLVLLQVLDCDVDLVGDNEVLAIVAERTTKERDVAPENLFRLNANVKPTVVRSVGPLEAGTT
jgi:hypothetical protein